ncbi:hypothetical protein PENANT_c002G09143 [Penicillium antarcticum]|uniref:Uncharacterized protein n=1 Tax=Penicillium antarcticum TaxID=416450 RepID=A0A1V6QLV8_9EURO|nr:hypothetical protein PENANT_c002G09143 [Penicillium antarcticum]
MFDLKMKIHIAIGTVAFNREGDVPWLWAKSNDVTYDSLFHSPSTEMGALTTRNTEPREPTKSIMDEQA